MALSALANIAAALAAGYKEVVQDNGNTSDPNRFTVTLEKWISGDPDGGNGQLYSAVGQGVSQVAAEAVALAGLNAKRGHRYGFDSGSVSKGKKNIASHTIDVT